MSIDLGKKFEEDYKKYWYKTFGTSSLCFRLKDQMNGFKVTSENPCDYICYLYPRLYFIECKETKENTLNWKSFPQYDRLIQYQGVSGLTPAVIIWYSKQDTVLLVSIKDCIKMHEEGKKSINIKDKDNDNYHIVQVPTKKLTKYLELDLSFLKDLDNDW